MYLLCVPQTRHKHIEDWTKGKIFNRKDDSG